MSIPGPKVSIVIQKVTRISDGMGGYKDVYTTRYTLNAGFSSLTASQRFMAKRESSDITNRVFCPYYSDITESDQVVYGGKTYQIETVVDPGQEHKHLELDLRLIK